MLLELNFPQKLISHLHLCMCASVKGRLKEREKERSGCIYYRGSGFYSPFTFGGEAGNVGVGVCCPFDSRDVIRGLAVSCSPRPSSVSLPLAYVSKGL